MSNGSFASQLKNNKTIGVDKLENILRKYIDVNIEWLLTGRGDMFKINQSAEKDTVDTQKTKSTEDKSSDTLRIPLYNVTTTAGIIDLFGENRNQIPLDYISISRIYECDGALFVVGDGMQPIIRSGDIVIYKKINNPEKNIIWGEMYVVYVNNDGNEFFFTRFLMRSERESYVQFVAQNPHNQTIEFPLSSIKALTLVKASVKINSQF